MNLRLARVTLKLHRFEGIAAITATLVLGAWTLVMVLRLDGLGIASDCLAWLATDWTDAPASCQPALQQYLAILYARGPFDALVGLLRMDSWIWPVMGILPFAAGVLVSVPIVARELETGTAQTAWSLDGSRRRWLRRRIWPIALVVGLAMLFTAVTTELLAQRHLSDQALPLLGLHGLPVMARLLAAFGLGLLAGAIVRRSLPALVVGSVLCVALSFGVAQALDAWIDAQESLPRMEGETRKWTFNGEWTRIAPDGRFLTPEEVSALVPDELEAADVALEQPIHSGEWLGERGYALVPMGIPDSDAATGWLPYDVLLFSMAGVIAAAAAFVVVDRRRPT